MDATDKALQIHTSARAEAQSLFRLLGKHGNTIESLRELIAMPQTELRALREYAAAERAEAHWIGRALGFRKRVAAEFEKLVKAQESLRCSSVEKTPSELAENKEVATPFLPSLVA